MTLLKEIDERLAVCAKATAGPYYVGHTSEEYDTLDVHESKDGLLVAETMRNCDFHFLNASRNQREGELAALKVAVEAIERIFEICDETDELNGKRLAREALTQITKLMSEEQ